MTNLFESSMQLIHSFLKESEENIRMEIILDRRLLQEVQSNMKLLDTAKWQQASEEYKKAVILKLEEGAFVDWITFAGRLSRNGQGNSGRGLSKEVGELLAQLHAIKSICEILADFPEVQSIKLDSRLSGLRKKLNVLRMKLEERLS